MIANILFTCDVYISNHLTAPFIAFVYLSDSICILFSTNFMMQLNISVLVGFLLYSAVIVYRAAAGPSFTIDLEHDTFLKDGKPFIYLSGSLHYFRVPHYYWEDRLNKMFAAGVDAVQTYVAWNVHEPMPGQYDFGGQQDLIEFIKAAQKAGLLVILRPGPYICAEWEYGGFPAWLLSTNETFTIRSMKAPNYISAVDRWMSVLLPMLKPYLYSNGGPIIMVQVENEYGSYKSVDCGHDYMAHLRDLFLKYLGNDVVLFTTDGNDYSLLECGAIEGVYATVDFGPDQGVPAAFASMRKWNPKGPLVNSECYTGWLDHWGSGHAHHSIPELVNSLRNIRQYNASVSMYMFEGGTNFGFMNGADPDYTVCPTSYDYDAPLTEAGDITPKYLAIRNFTSEYKKLPPVPPNIPKYAYGEVRMTKVGTVLDLLHIIGSAKPYKSVYPVNAEMANYFYGFVLYRTVITQNYGSHVLSIPHVRDRAYVFINGSPRGLVFRNGVESLNIFATKGQILDIIVENEGRLNYGAGINDSKKGLISNVTLAGQILTGWEMYSLDFEKLFSEHPKNSLKFRPYSQLMTSIQLPFEPTVYSGRFVVPASLTAPQDTYLKMCGWFKGQVYINGFNVGRYWPVYGPQVTLYVPAGVLKPSPQTNAVLMVELDSAPSTAALSDRGVSARLAVEDDVIEFVTQPLIDNRCYSRHDVESVPPRVAAYSRGNN